MTCPKGGGGGGGGAGTSTNESRYGSEETYTSGTLTLNDQKKVMDWYEPDKKWVIANNPTTGKREVMETMANGQNVSGLPNVSMVKSGIHTESSGSSSPPIVSVLTTKNANGSLDIQFSRQRQNPRTGNVDTTYAKKVLVSQGNFIEVKKGVFAFKDRAGIRSNEAGRNFTIKNFGK